MPLLLPLGFHPELVARQRKPTEAITAIRRVRRAGHRPRTVVPKWNEEPQPASSGCSWLPRRVHQAPELWRNSIDEALLTIRVSLGATHQAESARQTGMPKPLDEALNEVVPKISEIINECKEKIYAQMQPLFFILFVFLVVSCFLQVTHETSASSFSLLPIVFYG